MKNFRRSGDLKSVLSDNTPIFLQIKEIIEDDILNGRLKPDEQIPSNSQLVNFYHINPVTVLKGVNLLLEEGLIYKKRGIGMFVSHDAQEILQKRFRKDFEKEHLFPLVQLAKPLGVSKKELHSMIDEIWEESESC